MKGALVIALFLSIAVAGCRARTVESSASAGAEAGPPRAASSGEGTAVAAASADPGRLPEDPVKGAESSAQWRAFMASEERERKLGYDRRKLDQHRAVMAMLSGARARYDRAKTAAAVAKVRSELPATTADIRRRIEHIDQWGNNSNLLDDYAALLSALEQDYPRARTSAIEGNSAALDALRGQWDERTKKMNAWLAEAKSSEGD